MGTKSIDNSYGIGTWGLGGVAYGFVSEKQAYETLLCAIETGVRLFDTANIYGNGKSERLLGNAIRECNESLDIITKGGYTNYDENSQCFDTTHLLRSLEESLDRLDIEKVTGFLLHSPPYTGVHKEYFRETYSTLKHSGMAENIGISVRSILDAEEALKDQIFDIIEISYNLEIFDSRAKSIVSQANACGVSVVAKYPLSRGFLTANYMDKTKFQHCDIRSKISAYELKKIHEKCHEYSRLAEEYHLSLLELAIQFFTASPNKIIPVPGVKNCEQLKLIDLAVNLPVLPAEDMEYIETRVIEINKSFI